MPQAFVHPKRGTKPGYTVYQAAVGENTPLKLNQLVKRLLANLQKKTAIIVETGPQKSVPWTAPQDYAVDTEEPKLDLFENDTLTLFYCVDGTVLRMYDSVTDMELRDLFKTAQ